MTELRSAVQKLEGKVSLKNQHIQRLEKLNFEFESIQKSQTEKFNKLYTELEQTKVEAQRLQLRVGNRGAPYF